MCSEHCCTAGFERAGIARLLYGEKYAQPDVDSFAPPALCAECGESGFARADLPGCVCFVGVASKMLCDDCVSNHSTLCEQVS